MNVFRTAASWVVWPGLLAIFLFAFAETQRRGLDPGLSLLALTVAHLAIIAGLEVLMPARRDWDWRKDGQVINDLIHGALLGVGARLGAATLAIAISVAAARLSTSAPLPVWPSDWPFLGQLALAVVLFDLVDYWKHRAYHAWSWAWPIHALHHNPERMHVFKAGRLHFIEAAIRAAITSAPLVIPGRASRSVLLGRGAPKRNGRSESLERRRPPAASATFFDFNSGSALASPCQRHSKWVAQSILLHIVVRSLVWHLH